MGDEDPQAFYKRLVVERCLYGVDANPLAVELAKLSLWLHTVSRDKALSFLDHHLRCGNSLIGARIEDDLMKEPPEFDARGRRTNADNQQLVLGFTEALTATHLQYFLDTFRKIMETPSGDAAMERQKDELYRTMDAVRDKFRAVANCWLVPFFGVPVTPQQYELSVNALRGTDTERLILAQEPWFEEAQVVSRQKRFVTVHVGDTRNAGFPAAISGTILWPWPPSPRCHKRSGSARLPRPRSTFTRSQGESLCWRRWCSAGRPQGSS
jgi:hypothetical protein